MKNDIDEKTKAEIVEQVTDFIQKQLDAGELKPSEVQEAITRALKQRLASAAAIKKRRNPSRLGEVIDIETYRNKINPGKVVYDTLQAHSLAFQVCAWIGPHYVDFLVEEWWAIDVGPKEHQALKADFLETGGYYYTPFSEEEIRARGRRLVEKIIRNQARIRKELKEKIRARVRRAH